MIARIAAGCLAACCLRLCQTICGRRVPGAPGTGHGNHRDVLGVHRGGCALGAVLAAHHLGWLARSLPLRGVVGAAGGLCGLTLPVLDGHLRQAGQVSAFSGIRQVLGDPNHQRRSCSPAC